MAMDMRNAHLSTEDVENLLGGESQISSRLLLHHLALCPECHKVAGYLLDLYQEGRVDLPLCPIEVNLALSRREARELWEHLQRYPFSRQQALVRDTGQFRSWGLCELLCKESECEAPRDPAHSQERALLAVEIAFLLQEWQPTEQLWLDELRGYALAHLGNARRVAGDLHAAEEAFISAQEIWEPAFKSMGDVLGYEARYLAFKASLRRAQRLLPEALALLEQALDAEPAVSLRACILINKAKTHEEMGSIDVAIGILGEARSLSVGESDGRIRLCLEQNYLDYLTKVGRFVEAAVAAPEVATLLGKLDSPIDAIRFRWTEARIAKGLGRSTEALDALLAVRREFAELGLGYDAALSSLELALMYAELGRSSDVLSVLEDALPILSALKLGRESAMSICLLTDALEERKNVTAELLSQVLDILRRAQVESISS